MGRSRAVRGFLRATAAFGLMLAPAFAEAPPPSSITVEGRASTDLAPDTARLTLGVSLDRPTAVAAASDVAAAAQAIVAQLKQDGVAEADVATGSVSLSALPPDDARGQPRRSANFRGTMTLLVIVRSVESAGALASHLVDRGANTIEGIDYSSSREPDVLDDLRAKAVRDARRKAEIYVGALGVHLGRVLEVTPGEGGAAPRFRELAEAPAPASAALPTRPGTLTLSTTVSIRWEVAQ